MNERMTGSPSLPRVSPLALLKEQRSHVLFVLSNAKTAQEGAFLDWYQCGYRQAVLMCAGVLNAQHYKRHQLDITQGRHAPLPFDYLAICELSVDGAEAASGLID